MNETVNAPANAKESDASRWMTYAVWASVIGILILLGWGLINNNATRPEVGKSAPEFGIEFFNGYEWETKTTADLVDMQGKVVVLNFWASWCIECRLEADLIEASWQKYKDQDVIFLGVAYADDENKSYLYLDEFNITYPNAPDLGTRISRDYEITGIPETFFISKDGTIAHFQYGPLNQQILDGVIGQLLAEDG